MKTFVLGLGAQKAGTTWLHEYLNAFDFSNFGLHKEYHVWDALFSDDCEEFKVTPSMLVEQESGALIANDASILRYSMQNFKGVYESYFANLLNENKWLTGDITPAYACLNSEQLFYIKSRIESMGMQVKVVFLMRDPFERCWSAVRMFKRNQNLSGSDDDYLKQLYRTNAFRFRTTYQETIAALEQVFDIEDVFYGFYENLFTKNSIESLSRFLCVTPNFAAIGQHYNISPKSETCRTDLQNEVVSFYQDVYAYCNKRFPVTQELWHKI